MDRPSDHSSYTAPRASLGALASSPRFLPLFLCQFFSAFSDNVVKNALGFMILARFATETSSALVALAGGLFMLPFFLLSAIGGDFADRMDKARMAQRLKAAEIGVAVIAAAGLAFDSTAILFVALFCFGVVSALFGPVKYGIIPDHLPTSDLPLANAAIEGSTFLAILGGAAIGTFAGTQADPTTRIGLAILVLALSLACYAAARFIPATGSSGTTADVDRNVFRSTARSLRHLAARPMSWRCGLATTIFWAMGTVVMSLMPVAVTHHFGGAETIVTIHLAIFAIALGLGSFVAASLSGGRILLLPSIFGGIVCALAIADVALTMAGVESPLRELSFAAYFAQSGTLRLAIDLALTAFGGGLIVVPTFAALQAAAKPDERGRIIAAASVLNAAGMTLAALLCAVLPLIGLGTAGLFAVTALGVALGTVWMALRLEMSMFRDALAMLFRVLYRIEVRGLENLDPDVCGANPIIAVNHVSFLDAAVVLSMLPRRPIFAIDTTIAQAWWLKPFVKPMNAMPLDPTKPLATRTLIAAVRTGQPLVIFPEGRLSVTGTLMKVYDGTGLVAERTGAAVVPVRLEGPERTPFSRLTKAQIATRLFPKIIVTILPPHHIKVADGLVGKTRRQAAGRQLYHIMSDLMYRTSMPAGSLFDAIASAATTHGMSRVAVEDPLAGPISYGRLLLGARALAVPFRALAASNLVEPGLVGPDGSTRKVSGASATLGLMLPSSAGTAIALLACQSAGRVAAMINFTAGSDAILAACEAAQIKTIVTSRAFVTKGKLDGLVETLRAKVDIVMLEDVRACLGKLALLKARLRRHKALVAVDPARPAVVLFTSGSEGMPKGVALSHRNLLANITQVAARIDFNRTDKVFNVLPTFHSFGLTGGLVLPLVHGVPVYLYPTPLHYRTIPELVYSSNATVLFGTDTFLTGYAKTANPYDLRSLRYVVAGAERVRASTRQTYAEKFGLRILEGYGITETAPVLALNTPMYNKEGTVGRLVPDTTYRLEPVPGIDEGGRLFVKGPNVMAGYLLASQPGVLQPPAEGWHDTGDIVAIDDVGFVTIKGRAKRFAKIGGEMVSLARVDQLTAELWPDAMSGCVALPDPRKGERIVCITTRKDASRRDLQDAARAAGLTELAVPSAVIVTDQLPLLGSGKVDFTRLKEVAEASDQAVAA